MMSALPPERPRRGHPGSAASREIVRYCCGGNDGQESDRGISRAPRFEGSIISFLSSRGLEAELATWLERPDTIATISCLNGAAVMEFLRHAAQLEGYADEDAGFAAGACGKLKGKNFQWWDNFLWLPLGFDDPGGQSD